MQSLPLRITQAFGLLSLLATAAYSANTSPVADAAEKSDLAAIRTLLERHADVNAPQADGMSALHWAVFHKDVEAAKILLQNKANVACTNQYGVAPLSVACQNGSSGIVELLLEH